MGVVATVVLCFGAASCRRSEELVLPIPKPPGRPIFAGDRIGGGRLLRFQKAKYPKALRHLGYQTVRVNVVVLEDGTLSEVTYQTGPTELLPATLAALKHWRYEPLRLFDPYTGRSEAVRFGTTIEMTFWPEWR
jgi:hypothetical protein